MPRSIFAVVGALALFAGVAILVGAERPQAQPVAPLATPTATPSATVAASTESPTASPSAPPLGGPIPEGYRVQIPRLLIDLPIAEGDIERDVVVQRTPENFAFHFPGTGIPGAGTNSYLYAHARRGMFLSLWNARVGDEVVISTPGGGALKYVITEIHPRVPPRDTSWIQPTPAERLTLQTSTGPNPEDPRFVVVATPA
jgi:LPXTG-site transpeptidase (sortase) family protein